jgi:hypothetical protein
MEGKWKEENDEEKAEETTNKHGKDGNAIEGTNFVGPIGCNAAVAVRAAVGSG